MATTVNNAFVEFMKEKVNLDQEKQKRLVRVGII